MPNIPLCILRGQAEACTGIAWLDTPIDAATVSTLSGDGERGGGGGGSPRPQNTLNSNSSTTGTSANASGGGASGGAGSSVINASPRAGANSLGLTALTSPNLRASLASPRTSAVGDAPTHPSKKTDGKLGTGGLSQEKTSGHGYDGLGVDSSNGMGVGKGMGLHQHVLSVGRNGHVLVQDVRNGYFPRQHMARSIAVLSSQVYITMSNHLVNILFLKNY